MTCSLPRQYTIAQSILECERDNFGVVQVERPMIILPNADESLMKFPTNNISFFRSTGRSNEKGFPGSWFPTPGIAGIATEEINRIYIDNGLEPLPLGKIIKGSDLTNGRNKFKHIREWAAEMLMIYCTKFVAFDYQSINTLANIYRITTPENVVALETLMEGYELINSFLKDIVYIIDSYFLTSWQLAISAILGKGIWDKYPEFCDFVKSYVSERQDMTSSMTYLGRFSLKNIATIPRENEEVAAFLLSNCAQMTNIYNPEFKQNGSHYRSDISVFEQRYNMAMLAISSLYKNAVKNGNLFLPPPPPPAPVFVPESEPVFVSESETHKRSRSSNGVSKTHNTRSKKNGGKTVIKKRKPRSRRKRRVR